MMKMMTDETKTRMSISPTAGSRTRERISADASASSDARQPFAAREDADSSHVAPFVRRCGAFLIDYILAAAILAVMTLLSRTAAAGIGARTDSVIEGFGLLLAAAMLFFNFVILAGLTNRTFGKWAMGLRIERTNGDAVSIARILMRHLIGYPLSLITLGIGFLIPVFNRDGRALHDFLFDTIVVRDDGEVCYKARTSRRRTSNQGRMPQR